MCDVMVVSVVLVVMLEFERCCSVVYVESGYEVGVMWMNVVLVLCCYCMLVMGVVWVVGLVCYC